MIARASGGAHTRISGGAKHIVICICSRVNVLSTTRQRQSPHAQKSKIKMRDPAGLCVQTPFFSLESCDHVQYVRRSARPSSAPLFLLTVSLRCGRQPQRQPCIHEIPTIESVAPLRTSRARTSETQCHSSRVMSGVERVCAPCDRLFCAPPAPLALPTPRPPVSRRESNA